MCIKCEIVELWIQTMFLGEAPAVDNCKKSINGTLDLFFEPIWYYVNYVSYVTWNITEIEDYQPKPWPPAKSLEKPFTDVDAEMFKPGRYNKKNLIAMQNKFNLRRTRKEMVAKSTSWWPMSVDCPRKYIGIQ